MKNIVIDGNKFSDLEGFYIEIDKLFTKNLSWNPGHSLDGFNDLLRGGFGVYEPEEVVHIKWIHFAKSRQDLGYKATTDYYQKILKKCHSTASEEIEKKFQDAKNGKGKTILDIIIDIIKDTDNSGHWCELEIEE